MAAEAEAAREARAKVQSHLLCPKRIGCKMFPFFFGSLGYSCRRWTEGFAGPTGSLRGHRRILVRSAIEIPSGKSWTSQCGNSPPKSSHSYWWYFCSLQTLNSISAEKNSTIIFPLPIDLLSHFMNGNGSSNGQSKAKQGKKSDWAWAGPPYPAHP